MREEARSLDCRAQDLMGPADTYLSTLGVGDEDDFHRPFSRGEDMYGLVGLVVRENKPHVPRKDPDEGRHVVVAANFGRVSLCVLPYREDQDHQKRRV